MAVRTPLVVVGAAAQPVARHHVVHVQPHAHEQVGTLAVEARHQQRQRVHEVRREVHHQPALEQRLAHEAEVEVLQVAQAAVDELARAAGGAAGVVGLLDERDRVAARGGVERNASSGDPAADHHHVEALVLEVGECLIAADHGRYVT